MIGTRGAAVLLAAGVLAAVIPSPGLAHQSAPAPWDTDHALAMFSESTPADTTGPEPVWSLAVSDSGRRVVILRNRFTEAGLGSFPTDSLKLRRFEVSTEAEYRDHVSLSTNAGVATLRVGGNGQPDSSTLRWLPPQDGQEREPSNVGTHPPIPLHASQYSLSRDGKFLLVLRLMPHGVNIRGETGHFGLLDYFDVSNPKRPRRVGATLEADGPLDNGAVSDDGSRVAVAIIYPDAPPRNTTKVVVFDRVGRTLSSPRIVVPATSVSGLQFEGRFLFVGMQRPPLPVFVQTSTTRTIDLYDLGK